MPEISLADLLAWEPRLRRLGEPHNPNDAAHDPMVERELSWAVTVRASAPMLPAIRGGELLLLPGRVLAEAGIELPVLLRELGGHSISAVVVDRHPGQPVAIPVLLAGTIPADFENEINRLLTEHRGALYRAGTELGRLLATATAAGADLDSILAAASGFLRAPVAVTGARLSSPAASAAAFPSDRPFASIGGNRVWCDDRFVTRLASGDFLWVGPVAPAGRALARLASERIAIAADAAIARVSDARPRGAARSAAIRDLLLAPAAEATRLASAIGLAANGRYRVVLAAAGVDPAGLQRALSRLGTIHESAPVDQLQTLLIELRADAAPANRPATRRTDSVNNAIFAQLRGPIACSGLASGVTAIPAAMRQARFAMALLGAGAISGSLARFDSLDDLGPFQLLFPLWGSPAVTAFAADALGELPARDRRGVLRQTLLAYLAAGGSHVDAATQLGIHRNTLAYRLKQIAVLTGRDPTDPAQHLTLHLALLANELPPKPDV